MYFVSIKKKLLNNTLLLLVGAFCLILALVIGLNLYQSQQNLVFSQNKLQKHLEDKGKLLIIANRYALHPMIQDNEIMNVREFIDSTVLLDDEIVYGAFMNTRGKMWAISDKDSIYRQLTPKHKSSHEFISSDKITELTVNNDHEILEFATVLYDGNEKLGVTFFGYSKKKLKNETFNLQKRAKKSALISIAIILIIVFGTLLLTYSITIKQAETITQPIASLAKSAKSIANGDYNLQIKAESNDEIGELSRDFDSMRKTVKVYTEQLQSMVQEKVSQVNDILENIHEGICTITLEGNIRGQHSASFRQILGVEPMDVQNLTTILNVDAATKEHFDDWLVLVRKRNKNMRWAKIIELCPLLEIKRLSDGKLQSLKLNFQKIYNKNNNVDRLMVQIVDNTESIILEKRAKEEKLQYEHQLKLVLGVTENSPETIELFILDSTQQLNEILNVFNHINGNEAAWKPEYMNLWRENIHTLKGNAGSLGFDRLSSSAHNCETILLSPEILSGANPTPPELKKALTDLLDFIEEINQKDKLLHGSNSQDNLQIPKSSMKQLIQRITQGDLSQKEIVDKLNILHWQSFEVLSQKYRRIIEKATLPSNAKIKFNIEKPDELFPRNLFDRIDSALIHVFRNTISHAFRGNYNGFHPEVTFAIKSTPEKIEISIEDNGLGIHPDKILSQAKALNIVAKDAQLTEDEIIDLIFHPNFTSANQTTLIAGRGIGMSMVKRVVTELNGQVNVYSKPNNGTKLVINLNNNSFEI